MANITIKKRDVGKNIEITFLNVTREGHRLQHVFTVRQGTSEKEIKKKIKDIIKEENAVRKIAEAEETIEVDLDDE